MTQSAALVCLRCGGPLGAVTAVPAVVECGFCGAVISVTSGAAAVTREGAPDELRAAQRRQAIQAFWQALGKLLETKPAYEALREASALHLGTGGQTEAVALVTIALARDVGRETGVDGRSSPRRRRGRSRPALRRPASARDRRAGP